MVKKPNYLRTAKHIGFFLSLATVYLTFVVLTFGCSNDKGGGDENPNLASISRKIFVTNSGGDRISVFDANANGNVGPIRSIGSNTGLSDPSSVFLDTENDELFAANSENDTITVYRRKDEGDVTPLRIIGGENTGLFVPQDVFVDNINNEVFVANADDTITVYERESRENASPKRTIGGENTGLSFLVAIFVDSKNNELFAVNAGNNTVTVYNRTDHGDPLPVRTLSLTPPDSSELELSTFPREIYIDTDNDELYIVDDSLKFVDSPVPVEVLVKSTITVYRREDEGNASPLRLIEGENTQLFSPRDISVDKNKGEIFVINSVNNSVTVYERTKGGNVSPLRTLFVADTNHAGSRAREMSSGIFIDQDNDEIYVSNLNNTITVYGTTDQGDVPPTRVIGPNTGLLEPEWIFVDSINEEIFVTNASSQVISVYGINDNGNIKPLRTIPQGFATPNGIFVSIDENEIFIVASARTSGLVSVFEGTNDNLLRSIDGANTGLSSSSTGIYLDQINHEIFVSDFFKITVHDESAEGDAMPLRILEGTDTQLEGAQGIFVDTADDEIFVANSFSNTITVYNRTDSGDSKPTRIIKGVNTGLDGPEGIFVDTVNDEIFVANSLSNTVTVYNRTDREDTKPKRIIKGVNTGLQGPSGIFVVEAP